MELKRIKTVRFDALVKESGRPEQVTLWTKPEDNRDFMKAVKGGRVVTVIQQNVGTKKDRGVVGFVTAKNAAYLVFPKRIGVATDSKVVGIKYDRVLPESAKGPIFKPKKQGAPGIPMRERRNYAEAKEEETELPQKTKSAKAAVARYTATVELIGKQLVTIEAEAESKAKAAKLLKARAAELEMDVAKAAVRRTIKGIRKAGG